MDRAKNPMDRQRQATACLTSSPPLTNEEMDGRIRMAGGVDRILADLPPVPSPAMPCRQWSAQLASNRTRMGRGRAIGLLGNLSRGDAVFRCGRGRPVPVPVPVPVLAVAATLSPPAADARPRERPVPTLPFAPLDKMARGRRWAPHRPTQNTARSLGGRSRRPSRRHLGSTGGAGRPVHLSSAPATGRPVCLRGSPLRALPCAPPVRFVFSFVLLAVYVLIIPFQFRVRTLHQQLCIPRPCMQAYDGS